MVCGVNVISIRGRIGWEICGWLGDWVVVGRSGEDEVSIGGGCVAWVSGGGVGCGGFQSGSVGVAMCSLLGGVTCVVRFSVDRCRFLVYGAQPLMVR